MDLCEEINDGTRFVKISELHIKINLRSVILVPLDDLFEISNIFIQGQDEEWNPEAKPFRSYNSKVLANKTYEFIVWRRRIYEEKVHVEISESGNNYTNLIANRDPLQDTGLFRILISKQNLKPFILELDELLVDANEIV